MWSERMIRVISQSTSERNHETRELFKQCKIYLDKGYSLTQSVRLVKEISYTTGFQNRTWYKELRKYAKSQGYV